MDCFEARPLLPFVSHAGESPAEWLAVRDHLAVCADCRAALDAELRHDQALSQRMLAVPVPLNQEARLLQQFARNSPQAASMIQTPPSRRVWWKTVSMLAPVLLLCGLLAIWSLPSSTRSLAEFLAAIGSAEISSAWPGSTQPDRPAGWTHIADLVAEPPRRFPQGPVPAAVVRFDFRPSRSANPVAGTLWIVAADRISDANDLPPLESAEILYSSGPARLIWNERGIVYVLETSGDVAALESLRLALKRSRQVA